MRFSLLLISLFLTFCFPLPAQSGENVYSFLQINPSSKATAMGNIPLAPLNNDVSMISHNPSLLDSNLHKQVGVSYLHYLGGISHISAAGAWHNNRYGTFGMSIVGLAYGSFEERDEYNNHLGNFSGSDIALGLHYGNQFSPILTVGGSLKAVISQMERYNSFGMCLDLGLRFNTPDRLLNATLAVKNVGLQFTTYTNEDRKSLPFEVQLAFSKKLAQAPFGISVSLNNLQTWNLYQPKDEIELDGTVKKEGWMSKTLNEIINHISVGIAIYPSKNFYIMGGYNFRRGNELTEDVRRGVVGFSFGAGIRIKAINIGYAYAKYHLAGTSNQVQVFINIADMVKK
jgi:hypothetical protein